MTTVHATLEIGPFLVRADEAARTAYLFSLAGNPDLRRCDFGSGEVMEILIGYADGDMTFEEAVEAFGETIPATPFDLVAHLVRQREFSLKTFGPGPRAKGVIDHIRKELVEIEADPTDLKEWVDLILLAFDGAWRAGHSPAQIVAGIDAKQTKNEGRDWPDWRTADPDKAIEHVRAQLDQPAGSEGRPDVVVPDDIARILVDALGVDREKVTADARLADDLGADSLDAIEILTTIEMERGCVITDTEAEAIVTVGDLVSILQMKA